MKIPENQFIIHLFIQIFLGTLHKIAGPGSKQAILLQGVTACIFISLQAGFLPIVGIFLNFHPAIGCLSGLIVIFSPLHLWVETSGSWEHFTVEKCAIFKAFQMDIPKKVASGRLYKPIKFRS